MFEKLVYTHSKGDSFFLLIYKIILNRTYT